MRCFLALVLITLMGFPLSGAESAPENTLPPQEVADGWLLLFDGTTSFGWKVQGQSEVKDGTWMLGGAKETTATLTTEFGGGLLVSFDFQAYGTSSRGPGVIARTKRTALLSEDAKDNEWSEWQKRWLKIVPRGNSLSTAARTLPRETWQRVLDDLEQLTAKDADWPGLEPATLAFSVPAECKLRIRNVACKPVGLKPIFNGKDLSGWKVFAGEKYKSQFSVTEKGELNVRNGPGDLQTEAQYDDFVLQLECISNGKHLNSGIFFRCLPGQYQNGYEAQIQNGYKDGDRTRPADFGTGAIYRRVPARKVVSNDHEWFAMTVVAHGRHVATWVNGYPTVDWTDDRAPDDNPRKGSKTGPGHLSIQGHDPTTDLSFRNLRIAKLPRAVEKK